MPAVTLKFKNRTASLYPPPRQKTMDPVQSLHRKPTAFVFAKCSMSLQILFAPGELVKRKLQWLYGLTAPDIRDVIMKSGK